MNASKIPGLVKYIILETDGKEHPLVFSTFIRHDEMAPASGGHLVAAGYAILTDGKAIVNGVGSGSLNLKSRPQDADIIQSLLR
jgi:hypothetical protein